MLRTLSISNDFTETPGPRSREEGDFSGDEFRETLLEPMFQEAIQSGQTLTVDLDGTVGYATSFLESAFGGLARTYDPEIVLKTLTFICKDEPSLVPEIQQYIKDARKKDTKKSA